MNSPSQRALTLDEIILQDEWVQKNPVDESDEESHGGCAGLKAPGKGVKRREGVGKTGAGPESPSQHDPSIDEIMEGEETNTCRPGCSGLWAVWPPPYLGLSCI